MWGVVCKEEELQFCDKRMLALTPVRIRPMTLSLMINEQSYERHTLLVCKIGEEIVENRAE